MIPYLAALVGCGTTAGLPMGEAEERSEDDFAPPPPATEAPTQVLLRGGGTVHLDADDGRSGEKAAGFGALDAIARGPDAAPAKPAPSDEDAGPSPASRAWFPEAFLWRPLVETGEDGTAEIEVRVPDQLSSFRVLALAHDDRGQQAGTTHRFQTRLPVHVDPVVPRWLHAGDRLELPVRVVNGTDGSLDAVLTVVASGALRGEGEARLALSAGGSDVRRIELVARGSGAATVRAAGAADPHADAAERTLEVLPTGRPVVTTESRRLSSEPFTLDAPRGADRSTERIEVVVFGGPWSVLQSEVERLAAGARPVDPAYGFALSAHVAALASATGVEVDADRQRLLRVHAWQRLAGLAQAPPPGRAADLLASLRGVEGDELVDALRPRLTRIVAQGQRTDGTWSRTDRSTLQQVLVQTAVAARALPPSERGPRLRASGAVERSLSTIDDAYTASVVLAADLVPTDDRARLQDLVRSAVEERRVGVPVTVRNARGEPPSHAERLAWAVLALDDADELAGALVAELLGMWSADAGFGAGAADAIALDAIARALPPRAVDVALTLRRDEQVVGSATLDPTQPRVPARFDLRPEAARTTLTLAAEPPAPGLVMIATRRSWVDWTAADRVPGVDVDVELERLEVGRTSALRFAIAAPSGSVVEVRQALPPGVSVAGPVRASRATVEPFPDEVVLTTSALQPGEVIEVAVSVVPTFAGRFSTSPLRISVDGGASVDLRPVSWLVD